MISFLEKLVTKIKTEHFDLSEVTIILPTQRAGVYVKKYLLENASKTTWMPKIITIDNFIKENSKLKQIDNIELLFTFYQIYLELEKEKADDFASFSKWAPTLLADFNEIDHYLINSKKIFSDLKNIKEIDNWSFNSTELTEIQSNYSFFWNKINDYYQKLNEKLISEEKGYSGMLYKWVATSVYDVVDFYKENSVYFAGFNALSTSEENIIDLFVSSGKGQLIIDSDKYYVDKEEHEAGYFIRKHIGKYGIKGFQTIENNFTENDKKIELISTQSGVLMAKTVGEILTNLSEEEIKKTAVVLADEQLLLPVLNSIPKEIKTFNVSMGYSLHNSPIFSLINSVFYLQESYLKYNKNSIHYKSFLNIIDHYLIKYSVDSYTVKQEIITGNRTFISSKFITKYEELKPIDFLFQKWDEKSLISDAFSSFKNLINVLKTSIGFKHNSMELEHLFSAEKLIKKIENKLQYFPYLKDLKTLKFLFLQHFKTETVAFIGEPLSGLQVIGMLETRALDYENLILVSVNENILPQANTANSFIPYELKRFYKLPTYKEKEAIYAHHFYRLLQRTTNSYLLYNNSTAGFGATEKSRYLEQIKEELGNKENITVIEKSVKTAINPNKIESNTIIKSDLIIEKIRALAEYGFSPSSLNTFIQCPLDFYYRYVVGLREEEEVEETIEASTLGTIIHNVLEELYKPFIEKIVQEKDVTKMLLEYKEILKEQFIKQYSNHYESGKNFLMLHAAESTIHNFLKQEKELSKEHPIEIIGLEKSAEIDFPITINKEEIKVKLKGKIDRIDRVNGKLRIIDYKTGAVEKSSLELKDLENICIETKYEKAFQLLLYSILMEEEIEKNTGFSCGIISFKKLNSGLLELVFSNGKRGTSKETWTPTKEERDEFKEKLSELIQNIFNKSKEFFHEEDAKYCKYCV